MQIYFPDLSIREALERIEKTSLNLPSPHNLGEIEIQIAKTELTNTLVFKFGKAAYQPLQEKYLKELEKIMLFYGLKPMKNDK